jgi:methylated-DNA-[protein]-cysteine S-methyltransferase
MSIEQQLQDLTGSLPDGLSEGVALGTGIADGYDYYESPVGEVVVTFNPNGVSSLGLASNDFETYFAHRFGRKLIRAEAPSAWSGHIPSAIEAGTPGRLPVDLRSVTAFQTRILRIAATIPKGEVRPYGWLAREADRPGAARAVGSTMARNPIPLIIPCHRVVRSDGTIGAYSLGGPHVKWELLTYEGADPVHLEDLAELQVRVQGNASTHIYCHPTCRAIRRSRPDNVVDFKSGRTAQAAGFRACELCRP